MRNYKLHSLSEYKKVNELRNNFGWGSKRISSFLFNQGIYIKIGTINGWIYDNKISYEERFIKKISEESKNLTKDKAYILRVLCGDGYISTNYRIGLEVLDLDFIQEFRRCINSIYDLDFKVTIRIRKTNFGEGKIYCGVLPSKNVYLDILRYGNSFKSKEWEVPKEILESQNIELKSSFLRGFFDSEGTIRYIRKGHAMLQVCSGNNKSLLIIKELLLNDFRIDMKISYNNQGVMILRAYRYQHIKNFSDKIGFTIKRKKDKLNFCLISYKRKGLRRYDPEFKLKVLRLLDQGISAPKIGKLFCFNYTNIYDFIKQRERLKSLNLDEKVE